MESSIKKRYIHFQIHSDTKRASLAFRMEINVKMFIIKIKKIYLKLNDVTTSSITLNNNEMNVFKIAPIIVMYVYFTIVRDII